MTQRILTSQEIKTFQETIYSLYRENQREFPWRETTLPYHIVVSEIMLQQTQVDRVIPKYRHFIESFPDFTTLAQASLEKVLSVWQGLGYNRRALALREIAVRVVSEFGGMLPSDPDVLQSLSGIGSYTARAIATFAFNKPSIFIETNIRSVFIHFFFENRTGIKDSDVLPLIEQTLDNINPRNWYYALMDYGAMLKQTHPNPGRRSAHYTRQSPFEGSNRQLRGNILKLLVRKPALTGAEIARVLDKSEEKISAVLSQLEKEGFIKQRKNRFSIA